MKFLSSLHKERSAYFIFMTLLGCAALASAGNALAVSISVNLPASAEQLGGQVDVGGPLGFVQQFYNFALMISGILAFGAIVYGGIKYTFAAGNPSGQSEGKEWIKSALMGLLLLAAASLILRTINPSLATPSLPTF